MGSRPVQSVVPPQCPELFHSSDEVLEDLLGRWGLAVAHCTDKEIESGGLRNIKLLMLCFVLFCLLFCYFVFFALLIYIFFLVYCLVVLRLFLVFVFLLSFISYFFWLLLCFMFPFLLSFLFWVCFLFLIFVLIRFLFVCFYYSIFGCSSVFVCYCLIICLMFYLSILCSSIIYLFNFWLHHVTCRVLVSQPGFGAELPG